MFLSITLGVGHLPFTEVKIIDISWNLFVGRGGQAFLVWMCYPLFRRGLARVMDTSGVSFKFFASLSSDQVSLSSLARPATPIVNAPKFWGCSVAMAVEPAAGFSCV